MDQHLCDQTPENIPVDNVSWQYTWVLLQSKFQATVSYPIAHQCKLPAHKGFATEQASTHFETARATEQGL